MQSYLDAIHHHNDPAVAVQLYRVFETSRHGTLSIYRFHSDYWGERLVIFVIHRGVYVHIELEASALADAETHISSLEDLARSVSIDEA